MRERERGRGREGGGREERRAVERRDSLSHPWERVRERERKSRDRREREREGKERELGGDKRQRRLSDGGADAVSFRAEAVD